MSLTRKRRPMATISMLAASAALHAAAWVALSRLRPAETPVRERIEIEVVRRERPPPPPAIRPEPPRPPLPRPVARRAVPAERPRPSPATPPTPEPPPALASAAPPAAPDTPRPIPKVGIALGSTVASGGFAVGVGNTAHGRAPEIAADPASVRPYAGGVPAARLSSQPRPVALPAIEYPPDARRAGVEGRVLLLLRIDARGAVTEVRVIDAPAPALARAAQEGARRFRFTPGLLEGEPVETEIRFTYTFLLE